MIREQVFTDMSCYPKVSDTATPIDVIEWFAKNVGITNLDDPSAKVKTIIDDVNESELARHEARRARESKAQDEFLDAMFNLDNGTAVLRQKADRTKPAAKQLKVAKKVAKKAAKPAKKVAKPVKAPQVVKPVKVIKPLVKKAKKSVIRKPAPKHKAVRKLPSSHQAAKIRRIEMLELLRAGTRIPMQPKAAKRGEFDFYQQQKNGLERIELETGLKILRVNRIKDNQSFYTLDNFERHQMAKKVCGNLNTDDRKDLISAIASGEMVWIEDVERGVVVGGSSMCILSRKHGMNIYTVFSGYYVIGWILLEEAVDAGKSEAKRESEISDLGDMLQAIDYLRIEKEVAARMPTSTPDEILEAAYREFKRVANNAGSTISEVLAVKDGQ